MNDVVNYPPGSPEPERRSRFAYQAWADACARTGVAVATWEHLLDDERYQWRLVYEDIASDAFAHLIVTAVQP